MYKYQSDKERRGRIQGAQRKTRRDGNPSEKAMKQFRHMPNYNTQMTN